MFDREFNFTEKQNILEFLDYNETSNDNIIFYPVDNFTYSLILVYSLTKLKFVRLIEHHNSAVRTSSCNIDYDPSIKQIHCTNIEGTHDHIKFIVDLIDTGIIYHTDERLMAIREALCIMGKINITGDKIYHINTDIIIDQHRFKSYSDKLDLLQSLGYHVVPFQKVPYYKFKQQLDFMEQASNNIYCIIDDRPNDNGTFKICSYIKNASV